MVALFISVSYVAKGQLYRFKYGSIFSVCKEVRELEFLSVLFLAQYVGKWTISTSGEVPIHLEYVAEYPPIFQYRNFYSSNTVVSSKENPKDVNI